MCTLAVALQTDRRWPLVVAANRDERLGRPAQDWDLRSGPSGVRFAAPLDLQAGGTWIGVAPTGLFAGVTNFHASPTPDPTRRSRGELVGLALAHPSAAAARQALGALEASRYNPFHLLVAGGDGAFLWRWDGESAGFDALGPGLHVVTESSAQGRCPRGELVRARWPLDLTAEKLHQLLSIHGQAGQPDICVHLDETYGTRSSVILRLAPSLAHSELFTTSAAPCTALPEDRSDLLQALAASGPAPARST